MGFVRFFASLKITVGLLAIILVALATGTIIESMHDASHARAVYYSWWFSGLMLALAVNVIASLIEKWPYSKLRIGYFVTHASMLVILAGALMTNFIKIDGQLGLWEGDTSNTIRVRQASGPMTPMELPFSVHLDAFEIDHYPGTRRPAMFRSRVTVIDPQTEAPVQAVIEMNRELHYGGFKFFQSSYEQRGGREATILSVSSDPGQSVVFAGYILLVLGMCIVLMTRLAVRETRETPKAAVITSTTTGGGLPTLGLIGIVGLIGLMSLTAVNANAKAFDDQVIDTLRLMPVQHDGRVMPLDTQAREDVKKVTGKRRWKGEDPVATVLGWSLSSEKWTNAAVVKVGKKEVRKALGLAPSQSHVSTDAITKNPLFFKLTDEARERLNQDLPLSPTLEGALELEGRLILLGSYFRNLAILTMPVSNNPVDPWVPPESLSSPQFLTGVMENLRAHDAIGYPSQRSMRREYVYNALRPSRLAWLILLPTVFLSMYSWIRDNARFDLIISIGLLIGFAVMTWGIGTRWVIAGRIPASNMYESMLFLAWGTGLFALLAAIFSKNRLVIFNSAAMSTLAKLLTDVLPMDSFIHPMPPVLSGTPWLAIHVPIIMVSYSVFTLGVLVAHMRVGIPLFAAGKTEAAKRMDQLLYWYMHVGSILLLAGILTGSIWAASSWGRYWGWDPKEVWSLIAFLAYMAILHSRLDRIIGAFGVAIASIAAFWMILMTYLGVNYVLAAGLHSYGFGGGSIVRWMIIFLIIEITFLVVATFAERRVRARAAVIRP